MQKYRITKEFILAFILLPYVTYSQSDRISKNLSIQTGYQNGYVFATNDFIRGANAEKDTINAFQAFTIKLAKQTTGENQWEQLYKYPNYGIGIYAADFYNPEEIGTPLAIYGFFNAPFKRWNKLTFNYEIGFGTTFNWKSFKLIQHLLCT